MPYTPPKDLGELLVDEVTPGRVMFVICFMLMAMGGCRWRIEVGKAFEEPGITSGTHSIRQFIAR